jgi:quercetin 2,3-dioxygenase
VVFGPGDFVQLGAERSQGAASPNLEVLLLGGLPIREPVVHYGPFVMNTREEIVQAMEDYQAGRLGQIPAQAMPHRHPGDVDLTGTTDA